MFARLNEPGFRKRALPISLKTWHWMIAQGLAPNRSELLRGEIVEKMPRSILHIKLAGRMLMLLLSLLPSGFWIRKEDPLSTHDSEPEPDLSVVMGSEADYESHPQTAKLVVEVSVSTLPEDREMAGIYAGANVDEYWIINATERRIEVHRGLRDGRYSEVTVFGEGQQASCASLPGVEVDVTALFEGLLVPA